MSTHLWPITLPHGTASKDGSRTKDGDDDMHCGRAGYAQDSIITVLFDTVQDLECRKSRLEDCTPEIDRCFASSLGHDYNAQ